MDDYIIDDGWKRRSVGRGDIIIRHHPEHERRAIKATKARWEREVDVKVEL